MAEHGDAIEEAVFWNSVDLLELDVDLVFYDATTAWFETDEADVASHEWRGLTFEPLRQRGHRKASAVIARPARSSQGRPGQSSAGGG